ncbi:MAG: ArsR/SmtB family transcription factor [Bacteroidota bacterium]|jgi:DNA-binding transcriptional ArsR family regulator
MASFKENKVVDQLVLPDAHLVRKSTLIFRALNHKLRQQILSLLAERKKMTVTELYEQLLLEQSVVSQHLAILRRTGFVTTKKEGKFVWYMIQEKRIEQVIKVLDLLML